MTVLEGLSEPDQIRAFIVAVLLLAPLVFAAMGENTYGDRPRGGSVQPEPQAAI